MTRPAPAAAGFSRPQPLRKKGGITLNFLLAKDQ
jgi:hypothetical protein